MAAFDTYALIPLIPIAPYHTIADIGCGGGKHTVPLGKFLYDGKLYALDVDQEKLDATVEALQKIRLTNVELLRSKQQKLPLEDDSLDGALASKVLHHVHNPTALLKDARRCLKKSGWLAIVENYEGEHGVDVDKMRAMMEKAELRIKTQRDLDGTQYMMLVRK